jgi:hypothetical protein
MPPRKKPGKELSVEGPSQVTGAQALEATQQRASTDPRQATVEVGRSEEPP